MKKQPWWSWRKGFRADPIPAMKQIPVKELRADVSGCCSSDEAESLKSGTRDV